MLQHSISEPALGRVSAAKPGGPWIYRGPKHPALEQAGKAAVAEISPLNEASRIAFEASRKATLGGILGTGNRISSVIQYPVATRDPLNLCQGRKNHLSAEDRRILRVMVKHNVRKLRGSQDYNDAVLMVEKTIMRAFAENASFCQNFFQNEAFANKLLEQTSRKIEQQLSGRIVQEEKLESLHPKPLRPGGHGAFCGPQCYCLRFQDAPLSLKSDSRVDFPHLWEETFKEKTTKSAAAVLDSVGAKTLGTLGRLPISG